MNTAILKELIGECEDRLVAMGVPRTDAESLMRYVQNGAIAAEAEARNADQFLLDFKRVGAVMLAERFGKSPQAIRKRRRALLNSHASVAPRVAS